jgi:hypothetical protein
VVIVLLASTWKGGLSLSVFSESLSILSRCPVNQNISDPKIGALQIGCKTKWRLSWKRVQRFWLNVNNLWIPYPEIRGGRGGVVGWNTMVLARKVAGSSPDEVDFSIYLILPAALWPWGRLSL